MFQSRTAQELAELRGMVANLQKQIDTIASRVAEVRTPARAKWERHSRPMYELETLILPTTPIPLHERKFEIVKPGIAKVTLCMSGREQFVNAYDHSGNKIPELCGRFKEVGLKVLERAGSLEWEVVAESA